MGQAFVPGLQVTRRTAIRRVRELPITGTLKVVVGQVVKSNDIVAEASLPGELHILRIGEKLGLIPAEVNSALKVKVGDAVTANQIICEHVGLFGLFKSRYLSPVAGVVELITERTGHVAIRDQAKPLTLSAYISGEVVSLVPNKSVTIETRAALVQGIFGVGGEKQGKLLALPVPNDAELGEADIPEKCEGLVLVGGARPTLEALRAASNRGAVGFVTGSIDDAALKGFLGYDIGIALTGDEKISLSIIITEGFGRIPMSERVAKLLKEFSGNDVSINGATQVRAGAVRPEIIIFPSAGQANSIEKTEEPFSNELALGTSIRLIRVPYFGQLGKVVELPQQAEKIASGTHARVLRAELEDGRIVTVPRANVELQRPAACQP